MTRQTYLDRRWPKTPIFQDIAKQWCADQSRMLLDLVWRGCDLLLHDDLREVPFSKHDEAKEESLNYLLALRIGQCMTGDEPFSMIPQPPETTKRKRGKGKSPTPDHGFVPYDFPRSVWPLEGKVLDHGRDLRAYLAEINGNFLTGRYATFSREGAMLGYLLHGDAIATLVEIGNRLKVQLNPHPHFHDRPHRVSVHRRKGNELRNRLSDFACNHLVLKIPTVSRSTA